MDEQPRRRRFRFTLWALLVAITVLTVITWWCFSYVTFKGRFARVVTGMSKSQVLALLGEPVGGSSHPFRGMARSTDSGASREIALKYGDPTYFFEWVYYGSRPGSVYSVYFGNAGTPNILLDDGVVIGKEYNDYGDEESP